jgi:Sugar phosphate isomerases/epimerases
LQRVGSAIVGLGRVGPGHHDEARDRGEAQLIVRGVELVGSWDVTRQSVEQIGELLAKNGLACVSIIPDHFSQKRWGKGAFTKFSLEYKPKEPRTHSTWARAADTLLVAKETGQANVGVTIDAGHSFVAGENVAEAAAVLSDFGRKLFHMHFSDNYRSWDDDMIVGSVHFAEFLELLQGLEAMLDDGAIEDIRGLIAEGDAVKSTAWQRTKIFGKRY